MWKMVEEQVDSKLASTLKHRHISIFLNTQEIHLRTERTNLHIYQQKKMTT